MQASGINNVLDFFTEPAWDPIEADFKSLYNVLLTGKKLAFLTSFLSQYVGCTHEVLLLFYWNC